MADEDKLSFVPQGTVQQVIQIDLGSLHFALPPLPEPTGELIETDASRPAVANPTTGPHRYTIYAPHNEGARVSIGAGNPSKGQDGVTIDTLSHIRLNAYGDGHSTVMTLGVKSAGVGSELNTSTTGFALYTQGAAQQMSKGQMFLCSQEEGIGILAEKGIHISSVDASVAIEAKENVSITSPGTVNISARKHDDTSPEVTALGVVYTGLALLDFGAGVAAYKSENVAGAIETVAGAGGILEQFPTEAAEELALGCMKTAGGAVDKAAAHIESVVAIVLGFKKNKKEQHEGRKGWSNRVAWAKWGASIVAELGAIIADVKELAGAGEEGSGNVKIEAQKSITIDADKSVKISGTGGVAISSVKSASLSGTIGASVKAHKTASVFGGMGASLKGMAGDVEVASDLKEAKITAKKSVKITSETEKVLVTGEEHVQLNSNNGEAFVHGQTGVYVGCCSGSAFAMKADVNEMTLGNFSTCEIFKDAKGKTDFPLATFTKQIAKLSVTNDSQITLTKSGIALKTPSLSLKSSDKPMRLKADKILLG